MKRQPSKIRKFPPKPATTLLVPFFQNPTQIIQIRKSGKQQEDPQHDCLYVNSIYN